MKATNAEEVVLERLRQKCHAAGGPRAGFVLRRASILYVQDQHPDLDLEAGISALLDSEFLKVSESGKFLFLTAEGAKRLSLP
jgi:hypothetical protein